MSPALEKDEIEIRVAAAELLDRLEVHRGVLANRRVRTAAGLHPDDPIGGERLAAHEELHVLPREDVVGDDAQLIPIAHRLAKRIDQRRLARPYRAADSDSERFAYHVHSNARLPRRHEGHECTRNLLVLNLRVLRAFVASRASFHDRNNLEWRYCCDIAATSIAGANDSARAFLATIASTASGTRASVPASRRCASVCPRGIRRIAAETVAARRL